jgi:protein-S-isoprenylcysteine O-methyltransferase Ste14
MQPLLRTVAWLACVVYSTIPAFWILIHPRAEFWRARRRSPYRILLPIWFSMWAAMAATTFRWRNIVLYGNGWMWIPAIVLLCAGLILYKLSHQHFTLTQLGGLPEILPGVQQQNLVTTGIRGRVRHPVYLGHLCEMLAWSLGTGLLVCWALTVFAIATGAVMTAMEDRELDKRFGERYWEYRRKVPAIVPKIFS